MIYYNTEAKWYRFVFKFLRLSSLRRAFKGGLFFGVYAFMIQKGFEYFDVGFRISERIFETLAAAFTLLMVLRMSQSYNRWWEARKTWGNLVNNSRNLAIYLDRLIPEHLVAVKDSLASHIANFSNALAYHLRDDAPLPEYYEIDEKLTKKLEKGASHPIVFSTEILKEIQAQRTLNNIDGFDFQILKGFHASLVDILGINERIKKAPIPFSYVALIKLLIFSFGFLAPLQSIESVTVYLIPVFFSILMTLVMLLEIVSAEIEDPFETRENDLPLVQMANVISKDVFKILGQKEHSPRTTEMKEFHKVI
jgi:ion channel-forming bestrophin family protein